MSNAQMVVERLSAHGLILSTAESCTGGMVAAAITEVAGSSAIFDCGFVTYSNESKVEMLGVAKELIQQHGAVSKEAVSITGIAGPGGGTNAKPIGLVHFAMATGKNVRTVERRFGALSRDEIRKTSVEFALQMILEEVPVRVIRNEEATRFTARTGEP
jgi:nicotinamide-nucleotide amidase